MARGAPLLAALLVATPAVAGEAPSKVAPARLAAARAIVREAEKDAPGLRDDPERGALRNLARAQAAVGDVAAAEKTLAAVPSSLPDRQNTLFLVQAIAAAQAAAGDTAAALATVRTLPPLFVQGQALEAVVRAQVARGDVAGALRTAASASSPGDPNVTFHLMRAIAEAQARSGDRAGAIATLRSMPLPAPDPDVEMQVAMAQVENGDLAGALVTARAIVSPNRLALKGVPAALQTVASNVEEPAKSAALIGVARVQVERGDDTAAWATLGRVADPALRASAERAVALTLARAGDSTRLIEISRRRGDAYGRIVALAQAAEDVMKSEDELRQSGGSIFLAPE